MRCRRTNKIPSNTKKKMSDNLSVLSEDHYAGETGAQVGNYTLQDYLGHGSFGVIWGLLGNESHLKLAVRRMRVTERYAC